MISSEFKLLNFIKLLFLLAVIIFYPNLTFSKTTFDFLSDMSIEELMDININSAGFFDIPQDETPASVWIINEKDLIEIPGNSLKDILNQEVSGVMVSGHSLFVSLYSPRGAAMFDNSTSQFMLDGVNLNSAGSLGVNSSLKSTLLGNIEKIEVSTAPSGTINGNGALNGYLNMVPKKGSSHPGAYVNILYGTKEKLFKTEAGYGHVYGVSKDLYLYAGIEGSEGFKPDNDLGYAKYGYSDDKINDDFIVDKKDWYNYKASANWSHKSFNLNFLAKKEISTSNSFLSNSDIYSPQIYFNSVMAAPKLDIPLSKNESMIIKAPVSFFDWGYLASYQQNSNTRSIERGESDMRVEPELMVKTTSLKNHKIAAGVKFCYEHYRSNDYYFKSSPHATIADNDVDWREYTVFAEDIIKIKPWWTITAGTRFDKIIYDIKDEDGYISEFVKDSGVWSPRIASAFTLSENTTLKFSYQEGFHFPPATELYRNEYKPEEIKSYEINFLQRLPEIGLNITLNTFFNEYKNSMLALKESSKTKSDYNFGSYGGEFITKWRINNKFSNLFSYSFSRPVDLSDSVKSVDTATSEINHWNCYPEHIIKNRITGYFFNKKLMSSLTFQYSSGIKKPGDSSYFDSKELFEKDRFTMNFKAEYALNKNLFLNCTIKNIGHNNIPVPNYTYYMPWEGALGENETYIYLGFTWR